MLHVLRRERIGTPAALLTTLNETADRVSMHARADGTPARAGRGRGPAAHHGPDSVAVPERDLRGARWPRPCRAAVADGFTHVAFGDLFLEDVRRYREERLAGTGLTPIFPLWGSADADARARDDRRRPRGAPHLRSIRASCRRRSPDAGSTVRSSTTCRPGVDPCGERGEFHTCVIAGPMFSRRSTSTPGVIVERDGFVFADLVPLPPNGKQASPATDRPVDSRPKRTGPPVLG